jgi:hypothetical protein
MPNHLRAWSGPSSRLRRARLGAATILSCVSLACASSQPPPAKTAAPAPAAATARAATPPAVKLLSVAEARSLELGTVSITSVDRLLTNGATLVAKAVPMPIDPAGVRDMLLAQAGLAPEVSANLDLGAPAGAVIVSSGPSGATGAVMAVAARGPAEAGRVVGALGRVVETRGNVVLVENATGGRGWILRDGAVIVFSDDLEALARGARLAEEARHAVAEDVTAVLYPDAIARANGTDVKTALAQLMAQVRAVQAAQAPEAPGGARQLETFDEVLSLLGDAEAAEVGLGVDAAKGLSIRTRLRARAASKLEAVARDVRPYELDTSVLALDKTTPTVVGASSIGAFMRAQMTRQRERLAASKAKGAAAALAFHDAMMAALGGQTGFALGFVKTAPLFEGQIAYALKDAPSAAALGDALSKLDKDAALALLEAQIGQMGQIPAFDWTVKKESVGKLKALRYGLAFKKGSGLDPEVVSKLFGKTLDVYVAVEGTRFLATFGHDAKANLTKLAAAKPGVPSGSLAETIAATRGRDSFFHFDLAPLLSLIPTLIKDQKVAKLAKAEIGPIPLYGSAGGDGTGKAWSMDLTIPPTAFTNAGAVVRQAMQAGAVGGEQKDLAAPPKPKKEKKGATKK